MTAKQRIAQTVQILRDFGLPRAQINDRSALTLLALAGLSPEKNWSNLNRPLMGVTPIMEHIAGDFNVKYAPNTRETIRRQTLHQFVAAGIALYNPDKPDRPTNSPKACYQLSVEVAAILKKYGTPDYQTLLAQFIKKQSTLSARNAKARKMAMVPAKLPDGTTLKLSPGAHSDLIKDIVEQFLPRFAPGATVLFVGDTAGKNDHFDAKAFESIKAKVTKAGKLPDVVIHDTTKDWLFLVESVTSHGPIDAKRYRELTRLLGHARPGLVFVTAFPDAQMAKKYFADIAWETEVWLADQPSHLMHFNGDRFLGPR